MCRRPRLSGLRGTLLIRRARGGGITCNGKTVLVENIVRVFCVIVYTAVESEQAHGFISWVGSRFVDHVLRFGGYVGDFGVSIRRDSGLDSAECVKLFEGGCAVWWWHQLRGGRVVGVRCVWRSFHLFVNGVFLRMFQVYFRAGRRFENLRLRGAHCHTDHTHTGCTFHTIHTRTRSRFGPSSPKVND